MFRKMEEIKLTLDEHSKMLANLMTKAAKENAEELKNNLSQRDELNIIPLPLKSFDGVQVFEEKLQLSLDYYKHIVLLFLLIINLEYPFDFCFTFIFEYS
jgi:hypothetical protein